VSRIAVVKADKARGVEELLLRMARQGQLTARVSETQLIGFLEQISGQEKKSESRITVRTQTHRACGHTRARTYKGRARTHDHVGGLGHVLIPVLGVSVGVRWGG
jgi:hypothetical protein